MWWCGRIKGSKKNCKKRKFCKVFFCCCRWNMYICIHYITMQISLFLFLPSHQRHCVCTIHTKIFSFHISTCLFTSLLWMLFKGFTFTKKKTIESKMQKNIFTVIELQKYFLVYFLHKLNENSGERRMHLICLEKFSNCSLDTDTIYDSLQADDSFPHILDMNFQLFNHTSL